MGHKDVCLDDGTRRIAPNIGTVRINSMVMFARVNSMVMPASSGEREPILPASGQQLDR